MAVVAIYAGDPPTSACTPKLSASAASEVPGPARFVAWLPMPAMAAAEQSSLPLTRRRLAAAAAAAAVSLPLGVNKKRAAIP